jgi:hypothetical protein
MYHSVMAVAWRGDRVTVDVRFWHKADIEGVAECPLLGVKRTCLFALQMSAFDPYATKGIHHTSPAATYNGNLGLSYLYSDPFD